MCGRDRIKAERETQIHAAAAAVVIIPFAGEIKDPVASFLKMASLSD